MIEEERLKQWEAILALGKDTTEKAQTYKAGIEQKQVSKLDALDAVSGMLNELTPEQRETFNMAIKPIATCPTCGQDRRNSPTASCVYEHFCG